MKIDEIVEKIDSYLQNLEFDLFSPIHINKDNLDLISFKTIFQMTIGIALILVISDFIFWWAPSVQSFLLEIASMAAKLIAYCAISIGLITLTQGFFELIGYSKNKILGDKDG